MDRYKQILENSKHHKTYRPGDYTVLEVFFDYDKKTYLYDARGGDYKIGDQVLVDTSDSYKDVTVKEVYYFDKSNYPFVDMPLKSIIRKLDFQKVDNKSNEAKAYRPNMQEDVVAKESSVKSSGDAQIKVADDSRDTNSERTGISTWKIIGIIAIVIVLFGPKIKDFVIGLAPLTDEDIIGKWSNIDNEITFYSDGSFGVDNDKAGGNWQIINPDEKIISIEYSLTDRQIENYNEMLFEMIPELYYETDGMGLTEEEILDEMYENASIPPEGRYWLNRAEGKLSNEYETFSRQ